MSDFGLAPIKREGYKVSYDPVQTNPYLHPRSCGYVKLHDRMEHARAYFGWELMNGTDIEKLKRDPYWKYMED